MIFLREGVLWLLTSVMNNKRRGILQSTLNSMYRALVIKAQVFVKICWSETQTSFSLLTLSIPHSAKL